MSLLRRLFAWRPPREDAPPPPTVLCVHDDRDALTALNDALRREPWLVLSARSAHEALDAIARSEPTVLVTAQRLEDGSGVELARTLRLRWPDAACVVVTGFDQLAPVAAALQAGTVDRCLLTPWREAELRATVRQCLRRGPRPKAEEQRPARPTTRSYRVSRPA